MTRIKGMAFRAFTQDFARSFPIDPAIGYREIDLPTFDAWCAKHKLVDRSKDRDTINHKRNTARARLNECAVSQAYKVLGEPFHVRVGAFGKTYVITPAADGWHNKAARLPRVLESIVQTKQKFLQELLNGVDMNQWPQEVQEAIRDLNREGRQLIKQTIFSATQYLDEWKTLKARLAPLVTTTDLLPENGGQSDLFEDDEFDEDDEDAGDDDAADADEDETV